jgi:PAS domain S-box-containing protein
MDNASAARLSARSPKKGSLALAASRPTFQSSTAVRDRMSADERSSLLAAIVESSDDAIVSKDLNGIVTSWNPGAERLFGYAPDEIIGKSISILIPPECQNEEPEILDRIRSGEHVDRYETVRMRKDATLVHISLTVSPIRNAEGTIIGASKIARDASDRKRAQEEQLVILDELKHRMRNTLATVQAIAMQTLRSSAEERNAFIARLASLARANDLLTIENWNRAPLTEVIARALAPFRDIAGERIVTEGPDGLWLSASHAALLTMALHELATNAGKYGALSADTGRVRLAWNVDEDNSSPRLRLRWEESGGPLIEAPPSRSGFGSFLIERVLKSEGGVARLEYEPQGLIGTFELPCVSGN